MSFTDQKPWIVTKEDEKRPWSGYKDGRRFRCHMCGHRFKAGDTCRWVYANGKDSPCHYGNFFVCTECDGEDILERAAAHEEFGKQAFWWMQREA